MAITKDLASVIRKKLASDPALKIKVNSERLRMSVASEICRLRRKSHLTQKQLAAKAGMRQSAIARLENTDYESYSLKSLERIAEALNARVEVRFVDSPANVKLTTYATSIEYANLKEPSVGWYPRVNTSGAETFDLACA